MWNIEKDIPLLQNWIITKELFSIRLDTSWQQVKSTLLQMKAATCPLVGVGWRRHFPRPLASWNPYAMPAYQIMEPTLTKSHILYLMIKISHDYGFPLNAVHDNVYRYIWFHAFGEICFVKTNLNMCLL